MTLEMRSMSGSGQRHPHWGLQGGAGTSSQTGGKETVSAELSDKVGKCAVSLEREEKARKAT